jgi:uncharacterized protein (DUF2141 family)
MMKKITSVWFMLLLIIFVSLAATQDIQKETAETGTLTLLISSFDSDRGNAKIALCNSKEDYKKPDNTFRSANGVIKNGKSEWTFSHLPFGTHAIKVYHDENNNGKLDKNAFGMPKEKYGFSNNARATFGPRPYEKSQFAFNATNMSISITVE